MGSAATASCVAAAPEAAPLVRTQGGAVRGVRVGGVQRFTNIPFGQPTGGANRFQAPRPALPWSGVLDATSVAPWPPQAPDTYTDGPAPAISEDCLRLNIWAPGGPGPHPVYVWIYGGANTTGWCGDPAQSGETFARYGIVFVNFNYRVGVLGFLELGGIDGATDAGSGNNGIRDQLLALRWVKANIAAFGGENTASRPCVSSRRKPPKATSHCITV